MFKSYFVAACAVLLSLATYAQEDHSRLIHDYLKENISRYQLGEGDVMDLKITDQYYTESMDLEHVYAQQQIHHIPVFNALGNFAIKNGEVLYFSNNFESNIHQRANNYNPKISPASAISIASTQFGYDSSIEPVLISSENGQYLFSGEKISQDDIPVKLVYQPVNAENIRLAWDLSIHSLDGKHWWSVRVDAENGNIIDKTDWVVSCSFQQPSNAPNINFQKASFGKARASMLGDGSQYEVYALPIESPNHGNRSIVSEPADAIASPYGWHDVLGNNGAEFTITRGNNVWAFENRDGNQFPGTSPDGGSSLNFTFPLDLMQNPSAYTDAATVNLFYMNNIMHDVWYQYGFDEASGNFQKNNYFNGGAGEDYVEALCQDRADLGQENNASFGTPPDGNNPSMRMFTWTAPGGAPHLLTINSGTLAGTYPSAEASFGPDFTASTPITADLALIEDDNSGISTDSHDACDNVINGATLSGKIVVIRRGECNFDDKVKKAQNEGALAVIMVNNVLNELVNMAGDDPTINIPSIFITKESGDPIINSLIAGNTINATLQNVGPFIKDGDLDNGVMAHEYGHGISNRLTGGPSNAGCLDNDEQMGEGWSDFFAMVMTIEPGDKQSDARGMATYVLSQTASGGGLREYPYSTNMSINPFTYGDVPNQYNTRGSHGVGSIWATMLWDLNWALIGKYGFDPDLYNGTGGNNMAMQLVIDGLKLQPCSPGFVDGRDAILAADMALNSGDNQCLIWCVFSRRGLGWNADQGSSSNAYDQIESFDMPPTSFLACASCPQLSATNFETGESFFKIYPNPTNHLVNIAANNITGEIQVSLFDTKGRKVLDKTLESNKAQINVSGLNSGIYIMHIVSEGKIQTEKLIIR